MPFVNQDRGRLARREREARAERPLLEPGESRRLPALGGRDARGPSTNGLSTNGPS